MAKLKPWFHVITPREDLREGRPMDASEFAVHLDHVREGRAPEGLPGAGPVLRADVPDEEPQGPRRPDGPAALRGHRRDLGRLQHGHAVRRGQDALADPALPPGERRTGGPGLAGGRGDPGQGAGQAGARRRRRRSSSGQQFDSITGRGGKDGTPFRRTPWGEIAWQLGGAEGVRRRGPATTRRGSHPAGTRSGRCCPTVRP